MIAAITKATALAFLSVSASSAAELTDVTISLQPAYHAIPMWAAKKYGWFEELGLNVKITIFPSGAPQVKAAVEEKAWDIGIAGSVPNVIAGSQGILTIGINNDESATTEVIGKPGLTRKDNWPPTAEELRASIFAATPKSTGELLLRKCLEQNGLDFDDEHILLDLQQGPLMDKLSADGEDPQYACLWAPNTYTYRKANPTAEVMCSGRTLDFPIYGGLMVREEWADENPEIVAKVLAGYLRGVSFMQNVEVLDEVLSVSDSWHKESGIDSLTKADLQEDLHLRPLFNLDQQLDHLSRNFANEYTSDADKHYLALEDFLFDQGVIDNKFRPKEYVKDDYMKLVSQDPALRAFSYYGAEGSAALGATNFGASAPASASSSTDSGLSGGAIAGIIVGVFGGICLLVAVFVVKQKRSTPTTAFQEGEAA